MIVAGFWIEFNLATFGGSCPSRWPYSCCDIKCITLVKRLEQTFPFFFFGFEVWY